MKELKHKDDTIVIKNKSGALEYKYESDDSDATRHDTARGEYVRWKCEAGNYTVVFGQHTPFANPSCSKKKGEPMTIPVNSDPRTRGGYKYTVVVEIRDNKHVIGDPQVVIN